jgi:hypothetical protein
MTKSMHTAPVLVLKFGGTSVADSAAMRRVAEIVRNAGADGSRAVVVTSAMSKVTDGLLDASCFPSPPGGGSTRCSGRPRATSRICSAW